MINEARINEIAIAMGTNEEQIKAMFELSAEEAAAQFQAKGYDFTAEELEAFAANLKSMVSQSEELDENALDNVSGGSVTACVFLVGVLAGMIIAKKNPW